MYKLSISSCLHGRQQLMSNPNSRTVYKLNKAIIMQKTGRSRRCIKNDHSLLKNYPLGEEWRKYTHFPPFLLCQIQSLHKIINPEGGNCFPSRKAFLLLSKSPCFLLVSWADSCLPTSWIRQFSSSRSFSMAQKRPLVTSRTCPSLFSTQQTEALRT